VRPGRFLAALQKARYDNGTARAYSTPRFLKASSGEFSFSGRNWWRPADQTHEQPLHHVQLASLPEAAIQKNKPRNLRGAFSRTVLQL